MEFPIKNGDFPIKNVSLLKMAIEIVDFPMKNCDFPVRYVSLPEGIWRFPKSWGYPQLSSIILFCMFHYKPSSYWDTPHFRKPPFTHQMVDLNEW